MRIIGVALTLEGHWEPHMKWHMRSIHHRICIQEVPCAGEEDAEPCYKYNTIMVGANGLALKSLSSRHYLMSLDKLLNSEPQFIYKREGF